MFDTLLITTLFLIASLLVCLLTLRLSINIKYLFLLSFITDINEFFTTPLPTYFHPHPIYFDCPTNPPFILTVGPTPRLF